jgi:hypothetical protein
MSDPRPWYATHILHLGQEGRLPKRARHENISAKFSEPRTAEVQFWRITLPRTPVHKGKQKGRGSYKSPGPMLRSETPSCGAPLLGGSHLLRRRELRSALEMAQVGRGRYRLSHRDLRCRGEYESTLAGAVSDHL